MPRTRRDIARALDETPLVEDKSWRISAEAWPLSQAQVDELSRAGGYCAEFLAAVERLYVRSRLGKKVLRNRDFRVPWVAQYLDRGKPETLLKHASSEALSGVLPVVIRPDILITQDGFALTEIDCVPDGIGLTAFLNGLYGGAPEGIVGGDLMPELFYNAVAALRPGKADPLIAILVGEQSSTYRPEMEHLAAVLREKGRRVHCRDTADLMPMGDSFCIDVEGSPEDVDIVYRFWALFDQANVPVMGALMKAVEEGSIVVTPSMRPFQEEKLNLALLHHHLLGEYWRETLSPQALEWLLRSVPRSWVMDPAPLPPGAVLDGPLVGGRAMHDWRQLADASQKERDVVIKISGFDENAWGARGVLLGSDASHEEWRQGVEEAISRAATGLHVVQDYRKPVRLTHPVCKDGTEVVAQVQGRTRLCPYYLLNGGRADMGGVLATFCPADKKIVHGMRDAALLPCRLA
jgi:hypothetical protein